jgi:hypothetical protein
MTVWRKRNLVSNILLFLAAFTSFSVAQNAAVPEPGPPEFLWQIGKPDHNNAEFSLAPDRSFQFNADGYYIVGRSQSGESWPYVHPGPQDHWAGSRPHTFSVLFGLEKAPGAGECRLRFRLLDTHSQAPPRLRVEVNGTVFPVSLPVGAGDESLFGHPEKGKKHQFEVAFASSLLKQGDNEIRFTTESGNWFLYDWIGLESSSPQTLSPVDTRTAFESGKGLSVLIEKEGRLQQLIRLDVLHTGDPATAWVNIPGAASLPVQLRPGRQVLEVPIPAVARETALEVKLDLNGKSVASQPVTVQPVRKMTVYILPHSHTDIGYTESQTAIEEKQVQNLLKGIQYARQTASYPEGARFIWNVEVLWAADLYLRRLTEAQREEFIEAVKKGQVGLNGMYLNELTGLCRPEELLRLFRFSPQLAQRCGTTIDSAMISDVPGYTWGTVTAMAQAGIRYFSTAPNFFDRIGDILVQWENKPFYWTSPSGKEKVLVWIPLKGYAMSHMIRQLSFAFVSDYQEQLEARGYPYDIAHIRWSGHGDNAVPDPSISEFVREWTRRYAWPKFVISSTSTAFRAFEERYGSQLPQVRGDWTPYWEDGAGSSALETAMNRATSDRLSQAETLWALLNPKSYPAAAFEEAWRNTLLYSEHTWGAWCSVSDPENPMTREQWEIKKSYADQADWQSRDLLGKALPSGDSTKTATAVDVYNTTSWPRRDLVILSRELSSAGDRVSDSQGRPVPSQRLTSGELVFVASEVPPFSKRRYSISSEKAYSANRVIVQGDSLDNGLVKVQIDNSSGGIATLHASGIEGNLVDTASGHAINDYLYLPGDMLTDLESNGPVKISVKEAGPLAASLLIESEAPGCNRLTREVRLTAGFDYVELINTVDKKRAATSPKPGDWQFAQKGGKESVNFAFPFKVEGGVMRLDIPLGVMEPEIDQMPSACKNWFTVGRWADVSNQTYGITWATLDAPLLQVGGITATLLGSQTNPAVWRKSVEPAQKLYSWAMNNHWGTNYRAYQEGPVVFRYALRPHRQFSPDAATRWAIALSQPLIATPAVSSASVHPLLTVSPAGVVVLAFRPSEDGRAWIVSLFGASGNPEKATLRWGAPAPAAVWLSDTSEKPLRKIEGPLEVSPWEVVTVRAERMN